VSQDSSKDVPLTTFLVQFLTFIRSTRAATYRVIINTLKRLPHTSLDAAWGLTGLFGLYFIRYVCVYLGRKYPRRCADLLSRFKLHFLIQIFNSAPLFLPQRFAKRLCRCRLDPCCLALLPSQEEQVRQIPY